MMCFSKFLHCASKRLLVACGAMMVLGGLAAPSHADDPIDFSRDIRPILSENCFKCHGPDAKERKGSKGGLRLDTAEGARTDLGGKAVVPGRPEASELFRRITARDPGELMPPPESGKQLDSLEIERLKKWIGQGAEYASHWSYVKARRPDLPQLNNPAWPRNAIDSFILARLEREGLDPSPEADRAALVRRVALDLIGLPPSLTELDEVLNDSEPGAYERWVDRLLDKQAFGEHWAAWWLDLARYADSAGYADDPPRTIWAYRDYVIRSLNSNKRLDRFTLEQLAGDLLPDPAEEQLIATAFHRNTMTNNEGGTSDEEFRNEAVVDRVNTTLAVWMGTTMSCAQCHDHKYDPISQEDYFRFFALLNNTADADRRDEGPRLDLYTKEQKRQRNDLEMQIARLKETVQTVTPELAEAQADWEKLFATDVRYENAEPKKMGSQAGAAMTREENNVVRVERKGKTDVYTFEISMPGNEPVSALRLETLPDEKPPGGGVGHAGGNFVISGVRAAVTPPGGKPIPARYVRVEIPGEEKILSLAEVQVFRGTGNMALLGEADQSSTSNEGEAARAIDGNTNGDYKANSTTHTERSEDPWWELDLESMQPVDRLVIWNRTDNQLQERLRDFRLILLDENREPVWEKEIKEAPQPSAEFSLSGIQAIPFVYAHADYAQEDFGAEHVLDPDAKDKGWAISPQLGEPHTLTLIPAEPVEAAPGAKLTVSIEQLSKYEYATASRLRFSVTSDDRAFEFSRTPPDLLAVIRTAPQDREETDDEELSRYYLTIAPGLDEEREELAALEKQYEGVKPYTTVPVMRELAGDQRRKTHVQLRGNFLELADEVTAGLPATFHPAPESGAPDRLMMAQWLMDEENPLTARVMANHFWESIFGTGIVRTSEEFGAQGELPSHPELLDWLATELVRQKWDIKGFLRLLVSSATYRQSSQVTPELLERDPDNRLLARGPRFRLSAEVIRDQALFAGGLLSSKMHGPPVKPPRPASGLKAAFGSGIDWETSQGEDRFRRALYTTWRRSNPYPSMTTFDAPNREVCTVRRDRSNTPLQALVTLNDTVYFEAAQGLARRMVSAADTPEARARHGFRLCLGRMPAEVELTPLLKLYAQAYERFSSSKEKAVQVATEPLGEVPEEADVVELAAWTVVANVLLNLDEMFMKR